MLRQTSAGVDNKAFATDEPAPSNEHGSKAATWRYVDNEDALVSKDE